MKQYSSSHDILVNGYEYFNKFLMTALLWMSRVTSRLHCATRNLWIDESFHFCAGRVVKNVQNKPLNASTLEPSIVTLKSFIKVEWNSCRFNFTFETLLTSLDAHRGHGGHKKKMKNRLRLVTVLQQNLDLRGRLFGRLRLWHFRFHRRHTAISRERCKMAASCVLCNI